MGNNRTTHKHTRRLPNRILEQARRITKPRRNLRPNLPRTLPIPHRRLRISSRIQHLRPRLPPIPTRRKPTPSAKLSTHGLLRHRHHWSLRHTRRPHLTSMGRGRPTLEQPRTMGPHEDANYHRRRSRRSNLLRMGQMGSKPPNRRIQLTNPHINQQNLFRNNYLSFYCMLKLVAKTLNLT